MPIFEYKCQDCEKISEILMIGSQDTPTCGFCKSNNMEKLFSAHAAAGPVKNTMSEHAACCGSSPGQAAHCAGPGSCCGRTMS